MEQRLPSTLGIRMVDIGKSLLASSFSPKASGALQGGFQETLSTQ